MLKFSLAISLTACTALTPAQEAHKAALPLIDWVAVKNEIKAMLTTEQSIWPFDAPTTHSYGPFMIRHAWHCAGSYRTSDGHGGCDGARQRFDPERSWDDNTNLDKAKQLLYPIKQRFGPGLSWADLIILTGSTAIESMGGPNMGFCAGRIDDEDGTASLELGPTSEQQMYAPCETNGDCHAPLGPTTIGLIYVNPEGPMGQPDPNASRFQVRDTFARMAMNDSETVALIGGGHAFGKTHGACPTGPGPKPDEDPKNPWPGTCGAGPTMGKGVNTFTSGFEGPWTTRPTTWDNEYFNNLIKYTWENKTGPGGHQQWHQHDVTPTPGVPPLMMLTSDISLLYDELYNASVYRYAADQKALEHDFGWAWYKLVTRDMGPRSRCFVVANMTPEAQQFQYPLPPPPTSFPDFTAALRTDIRNAMAKQQPTFTPDVQDGKVYYGAAFVQLAYQCASTFRTTDYMGGCNGARIRFSPQKDWPANTNLTLVLGVLNTVYDAWKTKNVSWADLIVYAAQVALEDASNTTMTFCPGRTDAVDGNSTEFLQGYNYSLLTNTTVSQVFMRKAKTLGLSNREFVALRGKLRSKVLQIANGFSGSWSSNPGVLSNEYYRILLDPNTTWTCTGWLDGECKSSQSADVFMTTEDLAIRWEPSLYSIAVEFANNNTIWLNEFRGAWTKLMNSDRFDGPYGNLCSSSSTPTPTPSPPGSSSPSVGAIIGAAAGGLVVGCLLGFLLTRRNNRKQSEMYHKVGA